MTGSDRPHLVTTVPGPRSRAQVDILARHECPAVTARRARRAAALGAADQDPIVWARARGANVLDVDDNLFVDLTSGFGVALVGHADPEVVAAASAQAAALPHAMGDTFPDAQRIALLAELAAVTPPPLTVALLGLSGSDAVDAAVKTAVLATGRTGVLTFGPSYHGLALGVLPFQGYKPAFGEPFRGLLPAVVRRLPWACPAGSVAQILADGAVGLVLVEPVLGRGGTRVPPDGWLAEISDLARSAGALVAFDEVLTGCGRTGTWWAGPAQGVVPDLMCVGKALGGGFPLSACVGSESVMAAWGASTGEALHTQTFLGHPVGCAAARVVLARMRSGGLAQVLSRGRALTTALAARGFEVRGAGLLLAVGVGAGRGLAISRALLERGFLTLPADEDAVQLTPPMTLSDEQVTAFADTLVDLR